MNERILNAISDAELERRWAAVRTQMAQRKIDALVMQNNNDWLGGTVKWFTDLPATNGYPKTVREFSVPSSTAGIHAKHQAVPTATGMATGMATDMARPRTQSTPRRPDSHPLVRAEVGSILKPSNRTGIR